MAAAASAKKQTPPKSVDLEGKFRSEFGRDLLADEKRLLRWAGKVLDEPSLAMSPAKPRLVERRSKPRK